MSCGFERLSACFPDRASIDNLLVSANLSQDVVTDTKSTGIVQVPAVSTETTIDLAQRVVGRLLNGNTDLRARLRGAILAYSLPAPAPPDVLLIEEWLAPLGLGRLETVALTGQPCAILHGTIDFACRWLECLNESDAILVVGCDVANKSTERFFFNSVMGDAAVAGILTRTSMRHRVLASYIETHLLAAGGELSNPEDIAKFRAANPQYICAAIEACLVKAGLTTRDLAFISPHTPNSKIWDAVAKLLRMPREKILTDYLGQTGHLNSNDSAVHYLRAVVDGRIRDGDRILLVNPGFGGTRGCTLLQA